MDTGRKKPPSGQKNESEKAHFSPLARDEITILPSLLRAELRLEKGLYYETAENDVAMLFVCFFC
jgi:hypothetical protein